MDKSIAYKKTIFYVDEEGVSPVEEFLDRLDESAKAKITARIEFLGRHWREARRPLVDYLNDKLIAQERRINFEKLVKQGRVRLP